DCERFSPAKGGALSKRILFVGRRLPHKGVHVLLEAFRRLQDLRLELTIVGRPSDPDYEERLRTLADGLGVEFISNADDAEVLELMRTSAVTVLPSLHDPVQGVVAELMGFTPLESQACGTPV